MLFSKLCDLGLNNTVALIVSVLLCVAAGYFIGCFNFGIILSKHLYRGDVREKGSGNAGSTNMVRNYGVKAGILTLCGDFAKTALAVVLGMLFFLERGMFIAGIFCMIGHVFPMYYGFKGGKGVACFGIIVLLTSVKLGMWYIFVILILLFIAIVAITKYVSLGSVICAMLYPIVLNRFDSYWASIIPELKSLASLEIYAVILAAIVVFQHRSNISRLLNGQENKLSFKKKKDE